jgi:GAF domain-containing protein
MKNLNENADRQLVVLLGEVSKLFESGEPLTGVIKTAMEAIEALVNADRSMLFLHDPDKEVMRSMVATGVRNEQLTLPVGRGILGKTWMEAKVYNLADAFQDYHFDSTFDLETGYRTGSLVSVPVIDSRKKTIGVCQFLNKKDGKPFSTTDIRYIQIVAMFMGLMIDNSRMFTVSTNATVQLDALSHSCDQITSGDQLKAIMLDLIGSAKAAVDAERASLFLLDEVVSTLSTYVSDEVRMPPTIPLSHGIGANSIPKFRGLTEEKMPIGEARKGAVQIVNDPYHDPAFNKMIDYHTKFKTRSVCAVPVVSTKGVVLGVLEVVNKRSQEGFVGSDGRMLTSFTNVAAVAIENQKLKDLLGNGEAQIEMQKWIGEVEFETCDMPGRFKLPARKMEEIHMRDWDAMEWNGIGLFKVCFNLFQSFALLRRFQVHNYLFFTFLTGSVKDIMTTHITTGFMQSTSCSSPHIRSRDASSQTYSRESRYSQSSSPRWSMISITRHLTTGT